MLSNSLRTKSVIGFLFLFLMIAVISITMTIFSSSQYQQEMTQKLNRDIAEHIISETELLQDDQVNQPALENLFHQLMIYNPSIELYLIDLQGKILAYSAPEGAIKRSRIDLAPIRRYLSGDQAGITKADDPRNPGRQKVFSVAPITHQGKQLGYLYIILGSEQVDNVMQRVQGSYILKISLFVLLAGIVFSLLCGYAFFNWISARLQRLASAINAYKSGVDPHALPAMRSTTDRDEIDQLTRSFLDMAHTIQNQLDELQHNDTLRRELVANVSHDLRTPLSTLQGYIETLSLKDAEVSPEQRREYLSIALKHCSHLTALVEQLFELAKFDAQEIQPDPEAFNLAELVQDMLWKFQLPASHKQISLNARVQQGLPFVYADISLIERLLENLIENAMSHTPKGGLINISLLPGKTQMTVEIEDTGVGIPKSDIPYIFDRFYQQEKSRSRQEQSGLGLAIVKRIIELHNSQISVVSELNKGTCFTFSLPMVA